MFEMLKEYRDCFLEYDNLRNFQDKMKYLEDYQRDPIVNFNSQEEPTYMKYIINALEYANPNNPLNNIGAVRTIRKGASGINEIIRKSTQSKIDKLNDELSNYTYEDLWNILNR